jgi:hypothetical protein
MSGPPIPYSNPAPVILATPSNLGVETSLQYSNDHYYFALSIDPSGATNFNGPIVVEGTGAAVNILDANNNAAVIAYPIGIGAGRITLSSAGSTGVVGASYATLDGAQGNVTGNFNIAMNGSVSPGNILNYNPTGSLTQLGNASGIVQVLGSSGVGQVYDEVNHPVISNTSVVTTGSYTGTFGTIVDISYNPATSGYYLVSYTLTCNGVGISWGTPAGSANLNVGLTLTQGSLVFIQGSEVSYYGIQQGPLQDTRQVLVYLSGGVTVYNDFQAVGTPNAGSTGGLLVNIQPFA